jgi:hypothetical protein
MAVVLCGAVLATAAEPNAGQNQPAAPGPAGIIQNSTLTGTTVLNPQGQELGRIKDVLLDSQTGQASFVILDAAISGTGRAMLVVPFSALRVSRTASDNRLSAVLDLRPDQMRAAPQTQGNVAELLRNPQFLEQARSFYQVRTYTAARPIETPNELPPLVPAAATAPCPPIPYLAPAPCPCWPRFGSSYDCWPESLVDFSSE